MKKYILSILLLTTPLALAESTYSQGFLFRYQCYDTFENLIYDGIRVENRDDKVNYGLIRKIEIPGIDQCEIQIDPKLKTAKELCNHQFLKVEELNEPCEIIFNQ